MFFAIILKFLKLIYSTWISLENKAKDNITEEFKLVLISINHIQNVLF